MPSPLNNSKSHGVILLAVLLLSPISPLSLLTPPTLVHAQNEMRTWTGQNGKEIEARFLKKENNMISLQSPTGRNYRFPLERLSPADQKYLQRQQEGTAEESKENKGDKDWPFKTTEEDTPLVAEDAPENIEAETQKEKEAKEEESKAEEETDPEESSSSSDYLSTPVAKWPKAATSDKIKIEEIPPKSEEQDYQYRSPHFLFQFENALGVRVVEEAAEIFEAIYSAVAALPLGILSDVTEENEKPHLIELYEDKDLYFREGGRDQSLATYHLKSDKLMLPLETLGIKKSGSRYSNKGLESHQQIVHETVTKLIRPWTVKIGKEWWTKGLAEYFTSMPFKKGRFNFSNHDGQIQEYLQNHKGLEGKEIKMKPSRDLMEMSKQDWEKNLHDEHYIHALLHFYFFIHLDGKPEGQAMYDYVQSIGHGLSEEEAREKYLIRSRDDEVLHKELRKRLKKIDVEAQYKD